MGTNNSRNKIINTLMVLTALFTLIQGVYAEVNDNLISHYNLSETSGTLYDSLGNNNLTIHYNTIYDQIGKIGKAVNYSGTGYSTTHVNNLLDFGTQDFSICVWAFPTAQNNYMDVAGADMFNGSAYGGFYIQRRNNNTWLFDVRNNTDTYTDVSIYSTSLGYNNWAFVCGVRNGTTSHIYVNGTLEGSRASNGVQIIQPRTSFKIGTAADNLGNKYTGTIDEVSLWNKALNGTEINYLFNSGSGRTYPWTEIIPDEYMNFYADNERTSASINNFNATVEYNGSTLYYGTTNNTIVSSIPVDETINITLSSSGYFNQSHVNVALSNETTFNLTPIVYFTITAKDGYDNANINSFSALITNSSYSQTFSTLLSTITTTLYDTLGLFNITGNKQYYTPSTYSDHDVNETLEITLHAYNTSQTKSIASPYLVQIGRTRSLLLDTYFNNTAKFEIEVLHLTEHNNGTGVTLGESTDTYTETQTEYEISFTGGNTISINGLVPHNLSIRVLTYNINDVEGISQRFDISIQEESIIDNEEILGFSFDTSDARFWLFLIIGGSLIVLTLAFPGNFIGFIGGLFFLYYSLLFFLSGLPFVYGVIMITFCVLLFMREVSENPPIL